MSIKKLFCLRTFRNLFSSVPFTIKMVRHFPNAFEDYKPGISVKFTEKEIGVQVNDYVKNILKRLTPTRDRVDGGLYVGIAGISYMFYKLSKNPVFSDNKRLFLEKSLEYLTPSLEASIGDKTSFLLGDAGVYAIATVINKEIGNNYNDTLELYKSLYNYYLNPKFLKCGGDEFFVGRSGYLAGALWMSHELKTSIFTDDQLYKISDAIVASGREYSQKQRSPCPLMYHYYNTQYLGAAHGISFILQILLTVPGYIQHNKAAAADIKSTVEFLASLQTDEGNWPCCMEEIGQSDHKLVHWCHGAPGTVYVMAKAYLVYNDKKFLNACIKAGEVVWDKGLLKKGPGICHGVAGSGYVFLLLYRLTNDDKYLYRAKMFADFMNSDEFITNARIPDNPESLYEGTAGTVCFLSDLLQPNSAEFPFQDVFSTYLAHPN